MSAQSRLDPCAAQSLVAQVHAEDIARVRAHLDKALQAAEAEWAPADAVADALALALGEIALRLAHPNRAAEALERHAAWIRARPRERPDA
ncbi:MAG: hypothetical protein Q7S93_15355 [Phenylobacterium sp.]|uniref:hypothetical protein n=1 Tax=Phenylobacterium sp. TaxID=1871053 RepID=UPI00272862A6|nr:hypothetical protein [Phenylobacterium sp.]MDO8411429.1 hypothetical protein [Phenylobacterium sp.]